MAGTVEDDDDNDGNGTVVVTGITGLGTGEETGTLVIRNVMLDVSSASGTRHCNG